MMRFRDRADAGRRLAGRLTSLRSEKPIVLAIPRGGVPVARQVAQALDAPLDVLVVRKVGSPDSPELGIGAIAEGGELIPEAHSLWLLGGSTPDVERIAAREIQELGARVFLLRGSRPAPRVEGRTVILVDDGVTTGLTVRAAIGSLRKRHPHRLVLAVPCGVADTLTGLRDEVDDLVCLDQSPSGPIALWYEDFPTVTDAEVVAILEDARQATAPATFS